MASYKERTAHIQEELERRILHGISSEWEEALWYLESSDREKLHKPLFRLKDIRGNWGYWSGEKNEICLGRALVFNHSWDAVREILFHEMAHQFAEQVLDAKKEPPHGPKFRRACQLLRANPKASGNYRPLDKRIFQDLPSSEDKNMARIKKLMALAQSKNQHEANAAMAKAHELIAKHNVDLLSRNMNRKFESLFLGGPALRHFREDYQIANLLQEFYFVFGIWVPAYVLEKGKMGRVLEITGTAQNVKIASYVYDFVNHFIESQWSHYNKGRGLNRYRKTDYAVGIIEGFRSKLKLQAVEKKKDKDKYGLIKVEDPQLKKHMKYKYPQMINAKGRAPENNMKVLNDGMNVGKNLIISKGITLKKRNGRLLIGN